MIKLNYISDYKSFLGWNSLNNINLKQTLEKNYEYQYATGRPTYDAHYQLNKENDRCYMFLPHAYSWCSGCRTVG